MTNKLLIRQGGGASAQIDFLADYAPRKGVPLLEGNLPLLQLGHKFNDGEASQGFFKVVDPEAEFSSDGNRLRPHALVKLTEDASGTEYIIAWGRLGNGNDTGRRANYVGGDEIEHDVAVLDANSDLWGLPFRNGWSRPAETDWERLQALHAAKLNGSSSTANLHRSTTDITVNRVSNGHLVKVDTTTDLEAKDYPIGTEVSEIIRDIAEQAGKKWGVVLHHSGGSTHRCLLYIDNTDHTTYQTAVKISDDVADWDPSHATAPVFEPHWKQGKGKKSDTDAVISGLINVYGGTSDDPRTVFVETGESPDDWEIWVDVYNDAESRNATQATRVANTILNERKRPLIANQVSILMAASQTHLLTAGQSMQCKSVVINAGPDKDSYVWRRIAECKFEPAANGLWWAHLSLERPRLARPPSGGKAQPRSTSPKPAPTCEAPATSILHNWVNPNNDGCIGGTYFTSDGDPFFNSFAPAKWHGTAGATYDCSHTMWDDLTPGSTYDFSIDIADKGGVAAGKVFQVIEKDSLDNTLATHSIAIGARSNYTKYTISGSFGPLHANFDHAHFTWPTFYPKAFRNVIVSQTTSGSSDPDCIDYVSDPDDASPYYMPANEVIARDQQLQDAISAPKAARANLLNNSGGTVSAGDVVVVDETTDGAFTTTTSASYSGGWIGVVESSSIASGASGVVVLFGPVDFVNLGGASPTRGDYLFTSSTAKRATTSGTRGEGAFGQVIVNDADAEGQSGLPGAILWGIPDLSEATLDHGGLTGLGDDDHPQYVRTDLGGKEVISVVAASGSTETLSLADGNVHDVTLTDNCTLTLSGATNGVACRMAILLRQDGTGSRTVTWPGSVEWVGGAAPTLETAANAWNWVTLVTLDGGTTWFGDGGAAGSVGSSSSVPPPILLESGHATPFTFDEILQSSDGSDFLWASE